jgi:2-polyprenyl-3-methyl-5-hydroxy-6-metoxy-1,4-benzoquinol methylase
MKYSSFVQLEIQAASAEFSTHFNTLLRQVLVKYRPLICPFKDLLAIVPAEADILDVGCGNGLWLYLLQRFRSPRRLVGVDASFEAIDAARKGFSATGQIAEFFTSASPQSWPEGSFDIVTMIDVLHHIPPETQESFFAQAMAKLKPGGSLIYKDMCKRPAWRALCNQIHDLIFARQWIHHKDIRVVEYWAANSGLILDTSIECSMYWYGHELRRFTKPIK